MTVEKLGPERIEDALRLIWETFLQFVAPDYSEEGVRAFRDFIEDRETVESLEFFGAYEGGELAGALAVSEGRRHICCFFVAARHQGRGIGRALYEHLLQNSANSVYTVNSSPYAVEIYRRLGFAALSGEQLADGMRFTPMEYARERA